MRAYLLIFLALSSHAATVTSDDPAAAVNARTLPNGLRVITAPSDQAKTMQIRVVVNAGHYNEEPGKAGTAHLLEHYLFTDAKLDPSMTYIDAIKEKGGSGNAETATKKTSYYATVPARLAPWIVEMFGKILFHKTFDEALVQHSKKPVYLEIGQPQPIDPLIDLAQRLKPEATRIPTFEETEFGIREPSYRLVAHRLETARLNANDLATFYKRYYRPANMVLYVAGNFSEKQLIPLIEKAFGAEPAREGGGWVDPRPIPRIAPYFRSSSNSMKPMIEVGTKLTDLTLEDEMTVRSYTFGLAHRLMKDLRNTKGDTYGVRRHVGGSYNTGKATLEFEAPADKYSQTLEYVNNLIDAETRGSAFTPALFKETIDLYEKQFKLRDRDSSSMMSVAEGRYELDRDYANRPTGQTGYSAFKALKYDDYVQRLHRMYRKDMRIEILEEPPLVSKLEYLFLLIFSSAFWMWVGRRVFTRPFRHDQVHLVRKLAYPPAYVGQIVLGLGTTFLIYMILAIFYRNWLGISFVHRSFLISEYFFQFLCIGIAVFMFQIVFGMIVRKIMIVDGTLWLKSLGYRSATYPLADITDARLTNVFRALLSIWKTKYRFYFYGFKFWKPGILITLRDGRAIFVGVRDSAEALPQLLSMIKP